jgi:hypothetical protein
MFQISLLSVSTSAVAVLNNLVLPRLLWQIGGESPYFSMAALKSIQFIAFEFNSELSEIGANSFTSYSSLTSICLPCSVQVLGDNSFRDCSSLSTFTFESDSKLRRIEANALSGCLSLRSICLSASVEFSGDRSFAWCKLLSSFTFESGSKLGRIEAGALFECSSLRSICLPGSVEFVGYCSFSGCTLLSSFTFESGSKLRQIEADALSGCSSLKSICLPASLEMLDGLAFREASVSRLTIETGNRHFRLSGDFLLDFDGTHQPFIRDSKSFDYDTSAHKSSSTILSTDTFLK